MQTWAFLAPGTRGRNELQAGGAVWLRWEWLCRKERCVASKSVAFHVFWRLIDPCYKVKGFFYASHKDNQCFFSRPVLGNYLGYLALLGLECLWCSRSQSYPIHPRGICTWGWALCVSVLSIYSWDGAGVQFPV